MAFTSLEELYSQSATARAEKSTPVVEQPAPPDIEAEAETTPPADTGEKKTEATPAPQTTQEPPKSDTPPVSGEDDLPSDVQGLRAALKAERQKRQEFGTKASDYERQLAETKQRAEDYERLLRSMPAHQQHAQPQPQQKPQRQLPPDPVTDPEAALEYQSRVFAAELSHRDNAIYETRVVMSQEMMRAARPDYDEVEAIFAEERDRRLANGDDSLVRSLHAHPVPAKYAYEVGKQIKALREIGSDPDAYRKRLKDEILAELQAQQTPQTPQVPQVPTQKAPPPQSLASVPSVAPRSKPVFTGHTPITELYK